ncbi:MAG: ABC transporter ATP-binding protein [Anaerolineales bacterium]|nr:ABC transporter ATP-binding protein [Anaerolineales bacterium]
MAEFAVELDDISKHFGRVVAVDQISLSIHDGEFFSLLGPSGCGKTTTLRLIAGFELPTLGTIIIGGQEQGETPPFRRPVNTVFQNYALFPHMSIFDNVAFGLEMKKTPKTEIRKRVRNSLEMVQLPGMENRKPSQLSGGQQQRVALARALVNRPKVLLLDEPLGALDLKLRKAMQLELKALQHRVGITFVYVTHDQEEALTMSDRIAVMNKGKVLQIGPPEEIYDRPANRFVADFIGETNFLEGTAGEGDPMVVMVDNELPVPAPAKSGIGQGDPVVLAIRPEKIAIVADASEPGLISGVIVEVVYTGTDTRYLVRITDKTIITVRQQNVGHDLIRQFESGERVYLNWQLESSQILTG